jgi:hypothetical protein
VLADAANGMIKSTDDLMNRLTAALPSGCYGTPPPPVADSPAPKASKWPVAFVAIATILIVGGVAIWLLNGDRSSTTTPLVDAGTQRDTGRGGTKSGASDDSKKGVAPAVARGILGELGALKDKLDKAQPAERAALAESRTGVIARCESAIIEAQTQAGDAIKTGNVEKKHAIAQELAAIAASLKILITSHPATDAIIGAKEQQCLDIASILASQLGARD